MWVVSYVRACSACMLLLCLTLLYSTGENLEKFWDTGGGNREVQDPSMVAATASIFGSHVGLSQGGAVGAKQEPGRSAATDIAKLFPRATSLASSGFEAVPMRKPKARDMTSALSSLSLIHI